MWIFTNNSRLRRPIKSLPEEKCYLLRSKNSLTTIALASQGAEGKTYCSRSWFEIFLSKSCSSFSPGKGYSTETSELEGGSNSYQIYQTNFKPISPNTAGLRLLFHEKLLRLGSESVTLNITSYDKKTLSHLH